MQVTVSVVKARRRTSSSSCVRSSPTDGRSTPLAEDPNQDWLEGLYLRHERALYNIVYRWVWDEAEAQDIVQEAFVRLWRRRAHLRPKGAEAYAYRTALNLAASRRRRMRLLRWLPLSEEHEPASGRDELARGLQSEEETMRVRKALDKLPDKLKQTLMLCEFSTYSYEEIGGILGVPAGTVGSRRHQALKRLHLALSRDWLPDKG